MLCINENASVVSSSLCVFASVVRPLRGVRDDVNSGRHAKLTNPQRAFLLRATLARFFRQSTLSDVLLPVGVLA